MSTKTFNTRFQLKYDTWENWMKDENQFRLLEGEIAIAYIPESAGADGVLHEPAILFKVGNGEDNFQNLPFVSALAGDVPAWAKVTTHNDKKLSETTFTDALDAISLIQQVLGDMDLDQVDTVAERLNALEQSLSDQETFITETINTNLADYNTRLETIENDYLTSESLEKIGENFDDLSTEFQETKNRIDTFLDSKNIDTTVDTLHEIQNWMTTSGANVTDLTTAIATEKTNRETAITNLKTYTDEELAKMATHTGEVVSDLETSIKDYVDDAVEALEETLVVNFEDLKQKEEYVIFNCGSASLLTSEPIEE